MKSNSASRREPERNIVEGSTGLIKTIGDLSRARQAQEGESPWQVAVEIAKLGIWRHDFATNMTDCSAICKIQHGYSPDEPLNYAGLRERIVSSDQERWEQSILEAQLNGQEPAVEYRVEKPDGTIAWISSSGRCQYRDDGGLMSVVGVTIDITEQKLIEQQKDTFASITCHELKTPLTTLKGFTQLIKKQLGRFGGFQDQVKTLIKMEGQINVLIRLVNEMQDASKRQAGRLECNWGEINLGELVSGVAEMLQQTNHQHAIKVSRETECVLMGDRMRLEQVFTNLITNAIKYSPYANQIEILMERQPESVLVRVRDHGIGIPLEEHERIFAHFYRINTAQKRRTRGLGMGLYIVQEIVEQHRGRIWVESKEGEGSTFFVELPLSQLSEPELSTGDNSDGDGPRKDR
jgi:PAS domain S-box-containing protein